MQEGTNDFIAFNEYLDFVKTSLSSTSKVGAILENTEKGVDHYEKFHDVRMAVKRMNFNFDNQIHPRNLGVATINAKVYLDLMHKLYAQIRFDCYRNIQKMVQQKVEGFRRRQQERGAGG